MNIKYYIDHIDNTKRRSLEQLDDPWDNKVSMTDAAEVEKLMQEAVTQLE